MSSSFDLTKPYDIIFKDNENIRTPYLKQGYNYYNIKGEWILFTILPENKLLIHDRRRTHNEIYFLEVYDKLTSYKSLASIKKYPIKKPNELIDDFSKERTNEFTIKILNQLKEDLIKKFTIIKHTK